MTKDARLYRVRWEVEVEAETPLAAAEKARQYQTKPGTTATVFEVAEIHPYAIRRYGDPVAIDLGYQLNPARFLIQSGPCLANTNNCPTTLSKLPGFQFFINLGATF